jgi:beta-xylosidase
MAAVSYTNPVWPHAFADPFILRRQGMYYAYGTAPADAAGSQFPILRSKSLAEWEYLGHALRPLADPPAHAYWAPEVAERDGRFYLYYSATTSRSDEHHRLRLATADRPEGPFTNSGRLLLPEQGFTIDAHPFFDPATGRWYLYFATDFTEDEPHGTGLAVVPLADDMATPLEPPRLVLRASCPWQVYERNRNYKGRIWPAWHCIEGPCVIYHDKRYWCLYSGGAWRSPDYGIGYAVADHPLGPWRDDFAAHGPTVLKNTPPDVLGPGHNSVTTGPDSETTFIVYHAWDSALTARRMCIDPLDWTASGPRCRGPSTTPQPLPGAGGSAGGR